MYSEIKHACFYLTFSQKCLSRSLVENSAYVLNQYSLSLLWALLWKEMRPPCSWTSIFMWGKVTCFNFITDSSPFITDSSAHVFHSPFTFLKERRSKPEHLLKKNRGKLNASYQNPVTARSELLLTMCLQKVSGCQHLGSISDPSLGLMKSTPLFGTWKSWTFTSFPLLF